MLGVARSGYYAWCAHPESARAQENRRLTTKIKTLFIYNKARCGSPRIHQALRQQGETCGRHRVARLMRQAGLVARHRRQYRATTDSAHTLPVAPNLLARQFTVTELDRVWVSDITYISTWEGWLYLAAVMDLASRRIVGWAMQTTLEQSLVLRAVTAALLARRPAPGLILHSDRGSQYASHAYQGLLADHGLRPSMSRKGNCWDNAPMESFFHTFKVEGMEETVFRTRAEARQAIFSFIEVWYNRQRLHSSLGYVTPDEYEKLLQAV
jgi:transposase InsO family protein